MQHGRDAEVPDDPAKWEQARKLSNSPTHSIWLLQISTASILLPFVHHRRPASPLADAYGFYRVGLLGRAINLFAPPERVGPARLLKSRSPRPASPGTFPMSIAHRGGATWRRPVIHTPCVVMGFRALACARRIDGSQLNWLFEKLKIGKSCLCVLSTWIERLSISPAVANGPREKAWHIPDPRPQGHSDYKLKRRYSNRLDCSRSGITTMDMSKSLLHHAFGNKPVGDRAVDFDPAL